MGHPVGPDESASLGGLNPRDCSLVFQSRQRARDASFPLQMCRSGSPLLVPLHSGFMSLNPSPVSATGGRRQAEKGLLWMAGVGEGRVGVRRWVDR